MANGLTVYSQMPNALEFIEQMGGMIATSKLLGCENPAQGRVMAMTCLAKGCDPLSLAQRYDIIQGKLSMKSDAMLAEFRSRGGKHRIIQRDSDGAVVELSIAGETQTFGLLWVDAQEEDFTKGKKGEIKANYATPRKRMQMLWARVVSDGVRAMCPEVNTGVYTPEEVNDFNDDLDRADSPATVIDSSVTASADGPGEVIEEAVFKPIDPNGERASAQQIKALMTLFKELEMDSLVQLKAFQSVGSMGMADLDPVGANKLIAKLAPLVKQSEATGISDEAPGASNEPATGIVEACTSEQAEKLKSLIQSLAQTDNGVAAVQQIKAHMDKSGLAKFTELSTTEADALIAAISDGSRPMDHIFAKPFEEIGRAHV